MKRTKRIWALILALLATLCLLPGAAMAEGEYCYWHKDSSQHSGYYTYYQRSIHRSLDKSPAFGKKGGNILPAVYLLYEGESKDNPTKVYCCDAVTSVLPNEVAEIRYRRLTLENAGYYSVNNAKMIRAIAKNSYPFVTKDEMMETLNENKVQTIDITEDELLTAVQNAIWYFANGNDNVIEKPYSGTLYYHNKSDTAYYDEESNKYSGYSTLQSIDTVKTNITNVYNYLINIDPENAQDGGIVLNSVEATPLSTGTSGTVDVLLKFKLKNRGHEGSVIEIDKAKDNLTLTVNNDLNFKCDTWKDEGDGEYSVILKGVNTGADIPVTISGEQYLARDAYFYEPVNGRRAAQCFVGVAEGMTPVFARGSFRIDEKTERLAYLSVKKTSNIPGTYNFNVYEVTDDGEKGELVNTVELKTTENNPCIASKKVLLPVGTYIVEEEDAIKAGYTLTVTVTANGEEYTVNSEKVENPSVKVTLQGNGDAEVKIEFDNCYKEIPSSFWFKKTDEHGEGVKGAVFTLFKDEDCMDQPEYKQTSDSNGDVKFPKIPVGTYYMKETVAPYGYYLNKEVFKIEVLVQEASGTDNVAIYRKDAQDKWVKVEGSLEVENSRKPENHYTPEEPVPAIVVMPKTGDGSVLLSAAGLLLAAAAVCGLKRRIRG